MSLLVEGLSVRRVVVFGFGITGRAVVERCLETGMSVAVSEAGTLSPEQRAWLGARRLAFEEDGHTAALLDGADAIVLSPGVPAGVAAVEDARSRGLPILSELDFAQMQAPSVPVVAVTGTNGKGTTVTLIDLMLQAAGLTARLGGNIGTPFVSLLDRLDESDAVILEVSSYQLEQSERFRPRVGVLLNLAPDHLERHGTMDAYAAAKGRLFRLQGEDDVAVLPYELRNRFPQGRGRRRFYDHPLPSLPTWSESLSPHNRLNLAAALTAVDEVAPDLDSGHLPADRLRSAFELPHRLTVVGSVDGIRVVDDSKSTNAHSAVAALRAVDGPIVLLVGGRHKGAGYEALADEIRTGDVRCVVVFGEAANRLAATLRKSGIEPIEAGDLGEAVSRGLAAARPGDTLLFSPACSSFDAFDDYAARGDAFVRHVRAAGAGPADKDLSP